VSGEAFLAALIQRGKGRGKGTGQVDTPDYPIALEIIEVSASFGALS
jgi:hypothetical protein